MSIEIDEIDLDIEDEELDVDLDDVSLMPKKKGRPQSDHYVKESDLRDEIDISQANKEREISKLEALWNKKIDDATTDMEKEGEGGKPGREGREGEGDWWGGGTGGERGRRTGWRRGGYARRKSKSDCCSEY